MKPAEAFQYLLEQNLPLILSFQLKEEKEHIITGKGICFIEKIHGSSRVTLCRFSPIKIVGAIRNNPFLYATFEMQGKTYGCSIRDIVSDGAVVTASVPDFLSPFLRKYIRIEPSNKEPVLLHIQSGQHGTISLPVKDISESGIGFIDASALDIRSKLVCGIELPIQDKPFILADATVVYKVETPQHTAFAGSKNRSSGSLFYGLELFAHYEDRKKIRLYVMHREVEIRRLIYEQ